MKTAALEWSVYRPRHNQEIPDLRQETENHLEDLSQSKGSRINLRASLTVFWTPHGTWLHSPFTNWCVAFFRRHSLQLHAVPLVDEVKRHDCALAEKTPTKAPQVLQRGQV